MARERSIKLIITAQVDGARRALKETADAAKKVGDESDKASKRGTVASERLVHSARNNAQAWGTVGTTVAGVGVALTAGFGAAVGKAASFEKSMSGVRAVTNASASEMDALTQSALDMGAQTAFSASEAATAQGELARAGVSTADILGGALKGSMDLAAAGGLDLADAAIISAQAMNLFNLEGRDVGHIADVLASGANKSAADVSDLGQALGQAGTVASQTGLSLEETVGALSMFADAGIRGSDAGTSLKSMLQRLTPQSKEAQGVMEELGFSAYDAQGNFIGLEALAGELQSSFGGLDTESRNAALGVAFGSDAIRAASILMEGGATAAGEYTDAMNDTGAAAEMAATMMDNLAGDWEEFTGAMETALIQGGSAANDLLRGMVTAATDVVNVYNDMPRSVQGAIGILAGATGAAALGVGGLALAIPKYVELHDSMKALAEISPRAASGIGKFAGAVGKLGGGALVLTTVATGLQHITQASWDAAPGVEEVTRALLDMQDVGNNGQLDALIADMEIFGNGTVIRSEPIETLADAINRLDNPTAMQRMEDLDKIFPGVETSADRASEALGSVDAALARMVERGDVAGAQDALAEALRGTGIGAQTAMEYLPAYRESLVGIENEAKLAADGTGEMTAEIAAAEEEAKVAAEAFDGLKASIETLGGAMLGARGGARDFEAAIDAAAAAAEEHGKTLDISTEAGRANQAALDALAGSTVNYATAAFEAGAGSQEVAAIMAAGREEFIKSAEAMGMTNAEAQVLADRLGLIPENVQMMFEASGIPGIVQEIDGTVDYAASVQAMIQLGADPIAAIEAVDTYIEQTDAKTAMPKVDADTTPAEAKATEWEFDTSSMRPVPVVDADTDPADQASAGWYFDTNTMRPVPVVDADVTPAVESAAWWARNTSLLYPVASVGANTSPAITAADNAVWSINQKSATIDVYTRMMGALNLGASLGTIPNRAAGGIERYAGGNVRRPMMMGPGYGPTNVILAGEPETRGEAFISNHPNYKAQNVQYLKTAASWFGMDVVKAYASGGVAQQWSGGAGSDSSGLAGQVATLSAAVAAMPGLIEVPVYMDSRETARATARGMDKLGGRVVTSGRTRIGRRS